MGRFSPTVLPNSGAVLAQALGQGVNSYLQSRQQRIGRDESMLAQGYRPETDDEIHAEQAATAARAAAIAQHDAAAQHSSGVVNQDLATALNPGVGLPVPAGAAAPASSSGPDLASALGTPITLAGQRYTMTDQARARMAMALALQNAEIRGKNATAYKDTREGGTLRLGDPGFASAQGAVSGAQAAATAPYTVGNALAIRQGEIPLNIQEAAGKASAALPSEIAKIRAQGQAATGTGLAVEGARSTHEAQRQTNAQDFNMREQSARLAGEGYNQVNLQGVKEGGELLPGLVRTIRRNPLPQRGGAAQRPAAADPFADLHP